MTFRGTIYTDGMGVSVLKQNYDTKKKVGSGGGKSRLIKADEFQYVEKLGKEKLLAGVGKCVLIDPDCRGLHEKSTEAQEQLEERQSDCSRVFPITFQIFTCQQRQVCRISSRAKVTPVMKAYYLNEDHPAEEDWRAGGFLPFRKMKLSSFINQQQAQKQLARSL
ncbi:hypothetical protein G6F46_006761 [Rhizopus delemar]|nr:hypothetical protein G6F48_002297 [Rhizopus delemar]KAG1603035.1 hypothetical protein G6F47_002213 [Rhizopus delemar]KAG1614694.1 hypothetical protein G6F46_006761 [Rhizopus delemar]KAG1639414.1 hypothetical protein G6F44_007853 [Rhizopus delemar]